MGDNPKIVWLKRYLNLKRQVDNLKDELSVHENAAYLPAMPESDGSKHTPGRSDRMANATVKYMEKKQELMPIITSKETEMQAISNAIYAVKDPLKQEVLRLRYIKGDPGYRHMKWINVALTMYHSDDEADEKRVTRLHGEALLNLQMEDDSTDEENDL